MIYQIDLNTIDSSNQIPINSNIADFEELNEMEEHIKNQYVHFNNLGINIIDNIDQSYRPDILSNMLDYVNDKYLSIVDFDNAMSIPNKLLEVGNIAYSFICVDGFNTIIPNLLNRLNCDTLEDFDFIIQNKFKGDYTLLKENLVKTINNIVDELLKLQRIDSTVQSDTLYQKLLYKFSYFSELVDFGDTERFANNYIRPLLLKNIDSILWRIS
ncbi:MAG: hypothetical protein PHD05_00215 [Sphaerochaetaceae bacterium]|nr:hypothetical protein [Sphaerochaetaceae bacterium]